MDIRQFRLINSKGKVFDLNDLDSFFSDVRGLGFEQDFTFENVGDFFLEISKHPKQMTPKGTIIFSSYDKVFKFSDFIQEIPLTLIYGFPIDIGGSIGIPTLSLDVEIKSFERGEMRSGAISCDIEFLAKGYFYQNTEFTISEDSGSGGYPYEYPLVYQDETSGSVTIYGISIDSPCAISIFGPCENPSWNQYVNGVEENSGKVNCSVLAGERLVIDCQTIPYSIKKYDNFLNEIDDCYKDSDFSTGRFIYVKSGDNKISFTHEGSEPLRVVVSVKYNYQL